MLDRSEPRPRPPSVLGLEILEKIKDVEARVKRIESKLHALASAMQIDLNEELNAEWLAQEQAAQEQVTNPEPHDPPRVQERGMRRR